MTEAREVVLFLRGYGDRLGFAVLARRRPHAARQASQDRRLVFDRNEGRSKAEEEQEKAVIGTLSRRTERLVN
jgi:hypothetical protein